MAVVNCLIWPKASGRVRIVAQGDACDTSKPAWVCDSLGDDYGTVPVMLCTRLRAAARCRETGRKWLWKL